MQPKRIRTKKKYANPGRPSFDVVDSKAAKHFRTFVATTEFHRNSTLPLWLQLKNQLGAAIAQEMFVANSRLPSEQAMSEMFVLSRPVVRRALSALVSEGLIAKQARRGIFVCSKKPEIGFMTSALGVFDDLSAKGFDVSEKTYQFELCLANDTEQSALELPDGFNVIRFIRVYKIDGKPITHSHISLPAHRLPGMEKLDMESKSIFETIREMYGLSVSRAERWLSASNVFGETAKRLEVEDGSAMIYIRSIAYDYDNVPLEFYTSHYNAEVAPIHLAAEASQA